MHFVKRALRQVREQAARPLEWISKKIPPNRFIGRPKVDPDSVVENKEVPEDSYSPFARPAEGFHKVSEDDAAYLRGVPISWVLKQKERVQREIEKERELLKNRDNKFKYQIMLRCYKLRNKLQDILDKAEEKK